ncbi:sugar kinase [Rhizobium sp. FKL33]|uniref:sugar kinase n=1 Tax=Rhizobium sp. FKL33 TaxID=2562307 RepID=UPI0014856922|nr:sugar kinase [Rhizobium sp. FKL33]
MIELASAGADLLRAGVAGDSLNTGWYLRKLCPEDWSIHYLTRLGRGRPSEQIARFITDAGLLLARVAAHQTRSVGMYMISLTDGERSFDYWRGQSAARRLMDCLDDVRVALVGADLVYLTGITLAIIGPKGRQSLFSLLREGRFRVAFDPNHRPRLWTSAKEARVAYIQMAATCEIVLPSFEDESALFADADPMATARRYAEAGSTEVLVKNGPGTGALSLNGRQTLLPAPNFTIPVDTTGAGDSYNAAYLVARMNGTSPIEANAFAQLVAANTVSRPGALVAPPLQLTGMFG